MPATVSVNGRTVVHKSSSGVATSFPDPCKTPTPGGPVPIPYPNIAQSSDSAKTTKKVKVDGNGVCVKGSNFAMSTGDEAGSALGVASNKIKGKAEFQNFSFDVKFEGKMVPRLGDPMTQNGGAPNAATPGEVQPPKPPAVGAEGDPEACERLKDKQIPGNEVDTEVEKCGMAREHAQGIRQDCADSGATATFRSTNTDCMDKIRAGFPAKGSDVKNKTISAKTLGKAPNAGDVPDGLKGFVGAYDEAGNITGVLGADGSVSPLGASPPASALTGDYDMHDAFGSSGARIRPGDAENQMRHDLNQAIGRGPAGESFDMVRHGPQANYPEWAEANGKKPKPGLMVPDVSKDDPLLVFDKNGQVYKIEDEQELRDLYACKNGGKDVPESWDWDRERWEKEKAAGNLDMEGIEPEDWDKFLASREEALGGLVA